MTARSCPTCRSIGPRRMLGDPWESDPWCADPWHASDGPAEALADAQAGLTRAEHARAARMTATAPPTGDLAGFDPADPSTWHPMHAAIASPMQHAAKLLGVRLGTNMAPGIEHLARALFPSGESDLRTGVRAILTHEGYDLDEIAAAEAPGHDERCEFDGRHWDCTDGEGASRHALADRIDQLTQELDVAMTAIAGAPVRRLTEELRQERLRHQVAEREVGDLRAEVERLQAALPDRIDPAHVRPMLRLLGPARMVLDKAAVLLGEHGDGAEAAEMAQRLTDWIGHPVTEEPAWATLPCEQDGACRTCRPCIARMVAGYAPGLIDGAPVPEEAPQAQEGAS